MKLSVIKEKLGIKDSKKIKKAISQISPADFKKEMQKDNGSILNLIKKKIKVD